jgi:hypothetical protein
MMCNARNWYKEMLPDYKDEKLRIAVLQRDI